MSDETRFQPGDTVVRMGPDAGDVKQFARYEVERYHPRAVDGLWLKGVPGHWNPDNFEKLA